MARKITSFWIVIITFLPHQNALQNMIAQVEWWTYTHQKTLLPWGNLWCNQIKNSSCHKDNRDMYKAHFYFLIIYSKTWILLIRNITILTIIHDNDKRNILTNILSFVLFIRPFNDNITNNLKYCFNKKVCCIIFIIYLGN